MSAQIIQRAVAAISAGELVVVPTDTVYGIGARADLGSATDRIFRAKGRPPQTALPVLVASWEQAQQAGAFSAGAAAVARLVWPGAVTLVVPRAAGSVDWRLGGDATSIGLRIPAHPVTIAILQDAGAMAVSSANRTGDPPEVNCEGIREIFGTSVTVYVCDEHERQRSASTVVDLRGAEPQVLRHGDATANDLARWSDALRAGG